MRIVRRAVTADNPTGIYITYNLGWHNPQTGNFGGNITLAELNPSIPPAVYSVKIFFNDRNTFIQDYWGDYRVTHYQSGAYHVQPGTTLVGSPNRTRVYQFNAMYPVTGNATVQSAMFAAASLLHGPNYNDRETGFQRDDVRVLDPTPGLPTAPFGPFARSEGIKQTPGNMGPALPSADAGGTSNIGLYAGIGAGAVALILLIVAAIFIVRRNKAKKTEANSLKNTSKGNGWGAMDTGSSPSSIATITAPAPGSGHVGGASEKLPVVAPLPSAHTHGGIGKSGQTGPTREEYHPGLQELQGGTAGYNDVSQYVMGGETHEQQQLDFVEQYASANYQPNPYRDTLATIPAQQNGYRDTLQQTYAGYGEDAPPVPIIPSHHQQQQYQQQQQYDQPQQYGQQDEVDYTDMMDRYGHDSMYPGQYQGKFQYDQYDAPPMPANNNYADQDRYARDTFMPPPSATANHYGSSAGGSSTLKQRLEEEEAKLAAQQRQLAQNEMYYEDQTMLNNTSYQYSDEQPKTSGVVRSRSTVSKAPKSPMRTEPPRDWLGGAGSFTAGSELSRSAPGPNYI